MPSFRTILVAADFSENSKEAFRLRCSLVVAGQSHIHVLHDIEPDRVAEEPVPLGQTVIGHYELPIDRGRYASFERLSRMLMGSVAEYVILRSDCPALAVKTPRGVEETAPVQGPEPIAAAH